MTKKPLIAIVDDDESVRMALRGLLRSAGFSAEAFASAAEFLSARNFSRAACLLLDINMPGMTGFELHRHLLDSGRNIPTIMITGNSDDRNRANGMADSLVGCLGKPFTDHDLLQTIQLALQGPPPGRTKRA